jgi:predicted ester cyclase
VVSQFVAIIRASHYNSHLIQARKAKLPMSEENKAVSRRFHEAIGKGSTQTLQAEFAPNYVAHFPGVPGPLDAEGFNQLVNVFAAGFPGSHFDFEDEFAVGDKVVTRWTWHAVHRGEFQGIPPTGKPVTMTGISILRLTDGKVVENTVELDQLGLLQQLGVVPAPGSTK